MVTPWLAPFVDDYLREIRACLDDSFVPALPRLTGSLRAAIEVERARVYALGNGGSSAIARTFAALVPGYLPPHLRATRLVEMWGADELIAEVTRAGFEESAVRLLDRDGIDGRDLVVLLSGSGNSRNLVAAARYCQGRGVPTIALTGAGGGLLGQLGIEGVQVASHDQQVIEDCVHAGLHLLLDRTAEALAPQPAGSEARWSAARQRVNDSMVVNLDWIDRLSTEVAEAAASGRRISLIVPEGGALGLSVEHIAHNISWDMPYQRRGTALHVRSGVTLSDYTGMVNDCGAPGTAATRLLEASRPDDLTVIFAQDADHAAVAAVRTQAATMRVAAYGWYGAVARPGRDETVSTVDVDELLLPLTAQIAGHVLMRVARAKLPRYLENVVDVEREELCARTGVAPLGAAGPTYDGPRDRYVRASP